MKQTVGDFVVSRLHAWGVRMFGYPGDASTASSAR
ncbi:TPP-dependent 2-oxoacid decarboxylase [Rhizobium redzepovicii]